MSTTDLCTEITIKTEDADELKLLSIKKEKLDETDETFHLTKYQYDTDKLIKSEEGYESDYNDNLGLSTSDIEKEFEKSENFTGNNQFIENETTAYKCNICNESFRIFLEYKAHRKQHFIEKRTCKLCNIVCQSISKLEVHMNVHLGVKPFKCSECEKSFVCKNQLKLHMRCHSTEKKYVCNKCNKGFRYLGALRSHMVCHNNVQLQEFKCQECGKISSSLQSHHKHLRQHGQKIEIKCQLCEKTFQSDRHLQTHLNTHTELKFPCEYCERIYQSLYRLKRHIKRAHIPNLCDKCNEIFYDRALYTKHMKQHNESKASTCSHCSKTFDKPKNLSEHIRLQHKEDGNVHKCPLCDKEFINASLLRNHVKTHDKCFQCKHCNKYFSSRYNLETHSVTHTGERNHKCQTCGKFYSTKTSLKNHQATHTDVRSYKCDQCPKLFKTNRRLYVHKFSHATEEKYQCEICRARFRVKQYLKYHMIKHSSVKPYECKVCNKRFKHKKSWEKHSNHDKHLAVEKERFDCSFCKTTWNGKTSLLEHIRQMHEKQQVSPTEIVLVKKELF